MNLVCLASVVSVAVLVGCGSAPEPVVITPGPPAAVEADAATLPVQTAPPPPAAAAPAPTLPVTTGVGSGSFTTHQPSAAPEATAHLARCAAGDMPGCHAAALDAYYRPRDPANDAAARGLFEKGCAGHYAPSCNGLGALYATGRGVPKDLARAAQLYRDACIAGASTACQHLAMALRRGEGVAPNPAAAARADARSACILAADAKKHPLATCPTL